MSGWGVMITHPNRERTACLNAERQGYQTWLPRTASGVLFPRYAFVLIVDAWESLLSTIGVSDLIRRGERPALLPQREVDDLRSRERGGVVVLPPRHAFRLGQLVEVDEGPFFGERGLYDGMPREGRAHVLLNLLGRRTRVELDEAALLGA